jgi:hypothetical protein
VVVPKPDQRLRKEGRELNRLTLLITVRPMPTILNYISVYFYVNCPFSMFRILDFRQGTMF